MHLHNGPLDRFTTLYLELLCKGRPLHEKVAQRIAIKGFKEAPENYLCEVTAKEVKEVLKCSLSTAYDYAAALRILADVSNFDSLYEMKRRDPPKVLPGFLEGTRS